MALKASSLLFAFGLRRSTLGCVHVGRAEPDVESDENCRCVVRDTHFLRAVTNRRARCRIETAGHVTVPALSVSQLLLEREELRTRQTGYTLRCRTPPGAGRSVAGRLRSRTNERISRGVLRPHRECRSGCRTCAGADDPGADCFRAADRSRSHARRRVHARVCVGGRARSWNCSRCRNGEVVLCSGVDGGSRSGLCQ